MPGSKKDEEYAEGYEAGRNGGALDDFAQSIVDTGSTADKGYHQGAKDRYDYGPLDSSSDSDSGSDDEGGCFLTTACVEHAGLPDDCHELAVMRNFRDSYVRAVPGGEEFIACYYDTAPGIVESIRSERNSSEILDSLFSELRKTVALIEHGRLKDGLASAKALYDGLRKKYSK